MENLILTVKNTINQFNLFKGKNGEVLEFFNDKGVKKVYNVHRYSNGSALLFKK